MFSTLFTVPAGLLAIFSLFLLTALAVMLSKRAKDKIGRLLGLEERANMEPDVFVKNRILKFLGFSMGGVLIVLQIWISQNIARDQAQATAEQARANENAEQGQRQERLRSAITHLGHDSDSVRLGGAYELFHLADDTPYLRQTVLDILCGHIRWRTTAPEYQQRYRDRPSEEVQSILNLMFVQEHNVFGEGRINLRTSWLDGVQLENARLRAADLTAASLRRASLAAAQLQGANLRGAQMHSVDLTGAYMQAADLTDARLNDGVLQDTHLQMAVLESAKLPRAILIGAQMHAANLSGAELHDAQMMSAVLMGADVIAYLQGADLMDAHLQGADLTGAQLQGASLFGAQLQGASLHWARLHQTSLDGAGLQGIQRGAAGDFAERITRSVGRESYTSTVRFGEPETYGLPQDTGAILGQYTAEHAQAWISEYERAIGAVRAQ